MKRACFRFALFLFVACAWVFQFARVEQQPMWQQGESWVLRSILRMYEREEFGFFRQGKSDWIAQRWVRERAGGMLGLGVLAVGRDEGRVFQESPPTVLDYAVMLRNMKRLGVKKLAMVVPMVWTDVDAVGRAALENEMSSFAALQTGVNLVRSGEMQSMPTAFFRASWLIPAARRQEFSRIPWVDRVREESAVLGEDRVVAGFSRLASEGGDSASNWLVARWGDRLVFSAAFLNFLADHAISVADLEIDPGARIASRDGKISLPLDEFGRLRVELGGVEKPNAIVQAPDLIGATSLPEHASWLMGATGNVDGNWTTETEQWLSQRAALSEIKSSWLWKISRVSAARSWNLLWLSVLVSMMIFWLPRLASQLLFFVGIVVVVVVQIVCVKGGGWWLPSGGMLVVFFLGLMLSPWKRENFSANRREGDDLRDEPTTDES